MNPPEHNEVFVLFKIVEEIGNALQQYSARVDAPAIWDRRTRSKAESVNWDISLRVMFWFIKSHLESAYLLQSSKTAAFLPYIALKNGGKVLKDVLISRMNEIQQLTALPEKPDEKVVDVG